MILGVEASEWEAKGALITAKEIDQQPRLWGETYEIFLKEGQALQNFLLPLFEKQELRIILTGAGSSAFVGDMAVPYMRKHLPYRVEAIATTDIVANPANYLKREVPTLLISCARSGNSPESIAAVDLADQCVDEIYHVFFTCNEEGKLHLRAKGNANIFSLLMPKDSNDQGFAMTGSLTSMTLSSLLFCHLDDLHDMKKTIEIIRERAEGYKESLIPLVKELVKAHFARYVYLGSSSLSGMARESALKTLELCAGDSTTHYDSVLGFRHGPKSVVNEETLTILYVANDPYTYAYDLDLLKEFAADKKGHVLAITDGLDAQVSKLADFHYAVNENAMETIDDTFLSFPYIITAQLIAFYNSLALGMTPDNPSPTGFVNRVVQGVHIYPYK
ncbi:SIS domain-containing protein [Gottschalkiaceae bacterium SANA]|nr:SIS domain-containing protein [Gottschalkiaceae bacterium SANA]